MLLHGDRLHPQALLLFDVLRKVRPESRIYQSDIFPLELEDCALGLVGNVAVFDLYECVRMLFDKDAAQVITPVDEEIAVDEEAELFASGPIAQTIVHERKCYQPAGDAHEDIRSFKIFIHKLNGWRKADKLAFVTPPTATQRCTALEAGILPDDLTYEEIIAFAALGSSRLFHEYVYSNKKCHVLLKRWFKGLFRIWYPKVALWAEDARSVDPLGQANDFCDREREAEFAQWLSSVIESSSSVATRADTDALLERLPAAVFEDESGDLTRLSSFQDSRCVSLSAEDGLRKGTHTPLKASLFDPALSCVDFSAPACRNRLKSLISHRRPLDRNPMTYFLYELIRSRHFDKALEYILKCASMKNNITWRQLAEALLMDTAIDLGLCEKGVSVDAFWRGQRWSDLEGQWWAATNPIDNYRNEKSLNNLVAIIHAAASACRKTSKHKSIAGLLDAEETDSPAKLSPSSTCWGVTLVSALIDHLGASPFCLDKEGMTPMFYAATSGCLSCLSFLKSRNCPIDTFDILRRSPFYCAACVGELESCKWLVTNGFDVANDKSVLRRTPMCKATWGDYPEVVQYLLDIKLDPCPIDSKKRTPLHTAVWGAAGGRSGLKVVGSVASEESAACAALLLAAPGGLKALEMFDADGNAPIHIAASTNALKAFPLLLQAGADPNLTSTTKLRWNALMCAAYRGHLAITKLLLEAGARMEDKDVHGRGPYEYAVRGGHLDIFEALYEFDCARGAAPPVSFLIDLLHCCAFDAQVDIMEFVIDRLKERQGVDADWFQQTLRPAVGFCDPPRDKTSKFASQLDESNCLLTPIHSVLLGQRILPLCREAFRSLPFPPFQRYEEDDTDEDGPPPDNALAAIGISSFAHFDCARKTIVWKHRKLALIDSLGKSTMCLSPSMITSVVHLLEFIGGSLPKSGLPDLFPLLSYCIGEDLDRRQKQWLSMQVRWGHGRSMPQPFSSEPEVIVSKAGLSVERSEFDNTSVYKVNFVGPLYSYELQRVARNLFCDAPMIDDFLAYCYNKLHAAVTRGPQLQSLQTQAFDMLCKVSQELAAQKSVNNEHPPSPSPLPKFTWQLYNHISTETFDTTEFSEKETQPFVGLPSCLCSLLNLSCSTTRNGSSSLLHLAVQRGDVQMFTRLCEALGAERVRAQLDAETNWESGQNRKSRFKDALSLCASQGDTEMAVSLRSFWDRNIQTDKEALEAAAQIAQAYGNADVAALFDPDVRNFASLPRLLWDLPAGDMETDDAAVHWAHLKEEAAEMETRCSDMVTSVEEAAADFAEVPVSSDGYRHIDTLESLDEITREMWSIVETLEHPVLGVDLEFHVPDSKHAVTGDNEPINHVRDITCLIQLCLGDLLAVIDPFALQQSICQHTEFRRLFQDPKILKVFHCGHMDLRRLLEDFDLTVVNIWDTYRITEIIRSEAAGFSAIVPKVIEGVAVNGCEKLQIFLNDAETRLRRVCELPQADGRYTGLEGLSRFYLPGTFVDKTYQRRDWRLRPLPKPMLLYAARDAQLLPVICQRQKLDLAIIVAAKQASKQTPQGDETREAVETQTRARINLAIRESSLRATALAVHGATRCPQRPKCRASNRHLKVM